MNGKQTSPNQMIRYILCFFVLVVALTATASATDYYVRTDGDDSHDGLSLGTAWATIQHAADSVGPDDTVLVQSGTYNENVVETTSGTADNRIVYQGVGDPVIDASGGSGFIISGDYVTVTGFSFKNAYYAIWINKANYANVSYNTMDDFSCNIGISVYGDHLSPYTPVYYPTVEHNTINTTFYAIKLAYGVWGGSVSYNALNTSHNAYGTLYFGGGIGTDGSQDPPEYGWKYYMDFIGNTIRGGRNGFAAGVLYRCYIADNDIAEYWHNGLNLHSTQYSTIENNWLGPADPDSTDAPNALFGDGSTRYWHNNIFRNNHVEHSANNAFKLGNGRDFVVEGLTIDYSAGHGIMFLEGYWDGITVSGNASFKDVSINTQSTSAVRWASDRVGDKYGDFWFKNVSISGPNLVSAWTFSGSPVNEKVHILNTNDARTWWTSLATLGEFRLYYLLDTEVVDTDGNPIEGATVTISNDVDSNYPSINYNWENKTTFITGSDGHTPLPGDEENSAAVMDFRATSSGKEYMSYTITAEKDGYTDSTNINPDNSWYRSDPNTYQNTVTIVLPITQTTGTLSGTVTDGTNPIQGTTVTDGTRTNTTDINGDYTLSNVPTGTYTVTASATGYQSQSHENIDVLEGPTTIIDFTLIPATLPSITSSSPSTPTTQDEGTTNTFMVTTDQTVASSWFLDDVLQAETLQSFTKTWDYTDSGMHNITYSGTNGNGTVSHEWGVTVSDVPITIPTIHIWDTGQVETGNFYYLSAWLYRNSWTEISKGTTGEINNDLVLEGKSFWFYLHGSRYNANLGFMKGGYIPSDWSGSAATSDAPSRKNEMYRSYDTPNYYRAYGEGSETHEILINTEDEIIVRSISFPTTKPDGNWAVTTDYRILDGKSWMEIIPVNQASEQGFHGETKIIVVPDGNGIGSDYVADAYDYADGGVGSINFSQGPMMLDFFMEGDGIWLMTWPTPSTARPYGIWQYGGWPCGWDYVDGEPGGTLPNIWSSPFARFGDNGDESIYVGFLNGGWTHAYWNYQNINQYLSQGTTYSNWQITFSRSPRYHEAWTPLYPAIYRLIGKIDGSYYTQEVDLANIGDSIEFIMPVNGNLEYVLIYMYDRNANTPLDISTPMDIYRETILVNVGNISGIATDIVTGSVIRDAIVTDGTRSATTDESGVYAIIDMPVRDYTITASAIGYETVSKNITVIADQTITVDFQLTPDTTAPTITAYAPIGIDVSVASSISITFSEAMNQTSAESAFSILPYVSGSFNWDGNTMLFTPDSNLDNNTTYTVIMDTGAKDLGGINLESPYSWVFTTIVYDAGEISIWHFDEGDGPTAPDSSGNDNDGTIHGASWTEGILNSSALRFDGDDDYVSIPDSPSLNPADEITMEAWVKTGAIPQAGWNKIITKPYTSYTSPYQQYALTLNYDHFVFELNAGGSKSSVHSTVSLANNTWYHVAGTYNGSEMRIYVNGEPNGTLPKSGTIARYPTDVHIGAGIYSDAQTEYLNGTIDEVRILNIALSAEDIKADYEAGLEHNRPPTLTPIPDQSAIHTATTSFPITASDPDNDPLTFSAQNLPPGAHFNTSNQTFTWTPTYENVSWYRNIKFEVSDGQLTDTENITIFPRWDVDRNGIVNDDDRSLIAAHFEGPVSACPDCDVNLDSEINIIDYSLTGQHIDEKWGAGIGATPVTGVAISPESRTVAPGESFSVNISVTPDTGIAGMQFDLVFNASLVRVNSVLEGDLLKQNGTNTSFVNGTINNTAGTITNVFGCVLGHYNVTAPGTFAIINMTAMDSFGTSNLDLVDVIVSDPYGYATDVELASGTVTVNEVSPAPLVTNLTNDTPTPQSVNLTWECSVPDVDYYTVYRNGIFLASTVNEYYNVTGLSPDTTYTFDVSATSDSVTGANASITVRTAKAITHDVTISQPANATTREGVNATYRLTITNTGNVPDTFALTVTNIDSASAALNRTSMTLTAGESDIAILNVTSTTAGIYNVTVTAASPNASSSTGYIMTTVTDNMPPVISNPTADPPIIPDDTDNDPRWGEESQLNITATDDDGIESVTIDLSPIGGSSAQPMNHIRGNIWSVTTNASNGTAGFNGTAYTPHLLRVTATDIHGNSNTSAGISLTIVKNGDVNRDGEVDYFGDVAHLIRYLRGAIGFDVTEGIADVTGDGVVNDSDVTYLTNHLHGAAGYEILH